MFVNFDPQILSLIRETECMARLGLEIPPIATMMRSMQQKFKDLHGALNVSIALTAIIFMIDCKSFRLAYFFVYCFRAKVAFKFANNFFL